MNIELSHLNLTPKLELLNLLRSLRIYFFCSCVNQKPYLSDNPLLKRLIDLHAAIKLKPPIYLFLSCIFQYFVDL
jgi:hypothetical protein